MSTGVSVALAGNPNCGKTALFNLLTGSKQRVGNWPGVTVDRKSGVLQLPDQSIAVVDLPGIYSLSVMSAESSIDERIACQYLLNGDVDLIINVVDASNFERNLFLTTQLLEMNIPVVVAVNMLDILQKRGASMDIDALSRKLGCPVVGIVAANGAGVDVLKQQVSVSLTALVAPNAIAFPPEITQAVSQLSISVRGAQQHDLSCIDADWLARRLLEGDIMAQQVASVALQEQAQDLSMQIEQSLGEEPDIVMADTRYQFAHAASKSCITVSTLKRKTMTERIDTIVLNRWLGVPIFLLVIYAMFLFSINFGSAFQDFFDVGSDVLLVQGLAHVLTAWHVPGWLVAVLANGLGKGVNTTITFIPVIGAMFLFLAFLEDSGYMARAAFVVDRLMRMLGLPGKSFVPMIVGFGCNVPAVMGARTLSNPRDRILAVMMMPFMSCGARLAIFAVFASAFFRNDGASIIFLLYCIGIAAAVLTGFLLRKTVLAGDSEPLILELPTYHKPKLMVLLRHAWQRLKVFLTRAGKVIVPVCIVLGALNAVTLNGHLVSQKNDTPSVLSIIGKGITPLLYPMGIQSSNWPATVGLLAGVLAKEVVVGSLNTLYSQEDHLLSKQQSQFNLKQGLLAAWQTIPNNLSNLASAWRNPILANESSISVDQRVYGVMQKYFASTAAAFSYLLFVLLYFPCISTLAVMRREVGHAWANFSMLWSCGFAYLIAVLCYQLLTIRAHVLSSLGWVLAVGLCFSLIIMQLKSYARRAQGAT